MQSIKVKTIDNRTFETSVDETSTIADLKLLVTNHFEPDTTCETKIIFGGKILDDSTVIQDIGLTENNWLVSFFKKNIPPQNTNTNTNTNNDYSDNEYTDDDNSVDGSVRNDYSDTDSDRTVETDYDDNDYPNNYQHHNDNIDNYLDHVDNVLDNHEHYIRNVADNVADIYRTHNRYENAQVTIRLEDGSEPVNNIERIEILTQYLNRLINTGDIEDIGDRVVSENDLDEVGLQNYQMLQDIYPNLDRNDILQIYSQYHPDVGRAASVLGDM